MAKYIYIEVPQILVYISISIYVVIITNNIIT